MVSQVSRCEILPKMHNSGCVYPCMPLRNKLTGLCISALSANGLAKMESDPTPTFSAKALNALVFMTRHVLVRRKDAFLRDLHVRFGSIGVGPHKSCPTDRQKQIRIKRTSTARKGAIFRAPMRPPGTCAGCRKRDAWGGPTCAGQMRETIRYGKPA